MTYHEPTVLLSAEQIRAFQENGFVSIENLTSAEEVAWMREILDRLFQSRAGWKQGVHFDLAGTDAEDEPVRLPQILQPALLARELQSSQFRTNALAIARQLLGVEAQFMFDHAILKPPHHGAATPWHQDEAHRTDAQFDYAQVGVWIALQQTTLDNGCMQFIPGSHRGPVLPHRSLNDDHRIQALECAADFDRAEAVACPLPAGGATIHHCRTLHCAGPNHSGNPRRAYILTFHGKRPPIEKPEPYPWNATKRTAAHARAEAYCNRGGVLGRQARRVVRAARDLAKRARHRTNDRRS